MTYHIYRPLLRPAGFVTLPQGLVWQYAELPYDHPNPGAFPGLEVSRSYRYGLIATDRQLTFAEIDRFQLVPHGTLEMLPC